MQGNVSQIMEDIIIIGNLVTIKSLSLAKFVRVAQSRVTICIPNQLKQVYCANKIKPVVSQADHLKLITQYTIPRC